MGTVLGALGSRQVGGPDYTTVPAYPLLYPIAHAAMVVAAGIFALLLVFWMAAALFWYFRLVNQAINRATQPIPSLGEIDAQLRAEGYDPTIADVVAMHQYLSSQRNEAAICAVGLAVAPHFLIPGTHR